MLTLPTDQERAGVVMIGEDGRHQLAFALCLGLELTEPSLEIVTFTAGPDSSDIRIPNPSKKPSELRAHIIEHKRRMTEQKKKFYIEEIKNHLVPFFRQNIDKLAENLRNESRKNVESYLQRNVTNQVIFSANLQLKVFFLDFTHLELSGDDPEPAHRSNGEGSAGSNENIRFLEISPVINATRGGSIEQLKQGTEVLVRLAGESAELMGFSNDDEKKPPPLPAEFLRYKNSTDNSEGTLEVKLQEGIHGRCDVPEGTKVHKTEEPGIEETDPYVERMELLVVGVVALLILIVAVTIGLVVL